ncbi:hypothetical protein B296_00053473, partial [Ensete ventricosum]
MHPLKFPKSGIKAKVFVRKIGFKLCLMRLNRVELFYAQRLATKVGAAYEGGAATPGPLQGAIACRLVARKGLSPAASPAASRCSGAS